MQQLANMKSFSQATTQCLNSPQVSAQDKKILTETNTFLQSSYYATKLIIAAGFITMVDWRTPKSIFKREIPCAFAAFGLCALADYLSYRYAFGKAQGVLVRYTGFRDGVFVHPDKFGKMKKNYQLNSGKVYQDVDQNDLME